MNSLTFVASNNAERVAVFSAPSKSQPGKVHEVLYDWADDQAFCTCTASEFGRSCWHVEQVRAAYFTAIAARIVARHGADDAALVAIGATARRTVAERTAAGLDCPLDRAVLREACRVYKARDAARAARAIVAEWESLSYSDRHIDAHCDGRRGEREYDRARAMLMSTAA